MSGDYEKILKLIDEAQGCAVENNKPALTIRLLDVQKRFIAELERLDKRDAEEKLVELIAILDKKTQTST